MGVRDFTSSEIMNISLGRTKVINALDTEAYEGNFAVIHCLTNCVFAVLEEDADTPLIDTEIPGGTILYGKFTEVQLTSGAARIYGE